ncbi:MAG: hypothetical protein KZQ60_01500, partial [Candidatus Thiodiazotropha sp. (ex Lucinoma aequizonata)]|nr:hypothetical protein [Candidatus Thiodiazotropha sp. (ex Lucinoma aequizonata)]MCU7887229.1 hypothetical protein [Candidatus Thiodiazotropha sp. (ex Lucinoma aequizonata)]MCU7896902.1 hypothetical protein [Candidatus Thiodiazotropha sp. (ex Lucinoma aequizonata)]
MNGCFVASQQQINQIRRLYSIPQTLDSVITKRVFDLVKDFRTSQSTKIDSIFDSLLCPDR